MEGQTGLKRCRDEGEKRREHVDKEIEEEKFISRALYLNTS